MSLEITLQYFDGCPNWESTADDLRAVIAENRIKADVSRQLIDTPEAAAEHGFRGSPTVLCNGVDPFSDPEAPVGLSCRIYLTAEGLTGSPTREQLLEAMRAAKA